MDEYKYKETKNMLKRKWQIFQDLYILQKIKIETSRYKEPIKHELDLLYDELWTLNNIFMDGNGNFLDNYRKKIVKIYLY